MHHPYLGPTLVEHLDVTELPTGQETRLYLAMSHDALGMPVRIPVIVARGARPGPVFGLTAAVHGNEVNGIPVIHRLLDRVDLKILRGALVAIPVVNSPGFERHQRRFADGTDLNLIMPGRPVGTGAEVFAHRFIDRVIQQFDYLVDLHTASFGRVNSLYVRADMSEPVTAQMALLQRPQIILDDPPNDHTLRGSAMGLGIPAITIEIGDPLRFQTEFIRRSIAGLRAVLAEVGMLPGRRHGGAHGGGSPPVICRRSRWLYTDRGGLLEVFPRVVQHVRGGEPIARLTDAFGDVTRIYAAPNEGVVIGKSVNPVASTGARILHLGEIDTDRTHPDAQYSDHPEDPVH